MNAISELEEEYDRTRATDPREARKIEVSIARYNRALDLLSRGNNNSLVISFLEKRAKRLEAKTVTPSYTENPEELRKLALGLNPAA